jgi:hypothetical protein
VTRRFPVDQVASVVVLIHGLNSRPEALGALAETLKSHCETSDQSQLALFRYPNDQAIADSAKLLSIGRASVGRTNRVKNVKRSGLSLPAEN